MPDTLEIGQTRADGDALHAFVTDVAALRGRYPVGQELVGAIGGRLARLIQQRGWLCEQHRQPGRDAYRQYVLHVAPDGGCSVVSLVWRPGQQTPIHDHVAWCVVGVYEGEERETRYQLSTDENNGQFLVERSNCVVTQGHVSMLVPPDENIHRVTNCGSRTAISIHVYGADIRKLGTSINRCFDELPIQRAAIASKQTRWRDA